MAITSTELVDLLKALAWPGAAVWIAWYFREDLKRLLPNVEKIGPGGVSIRNAAQAAEQVNAKPDVPLASLSELKQFVSEDQLAPRMKWIRDNLPTDASRNEANKTEYLLAIAAAMTQQFLNEKRYRLIFGSQISLLKRLHEGLITSTSEATALYEVARSMAPEVYDRFDITFERWLSFLTSENLIADLPDGKLVITPEGKGLLRYLLDNRISDAKAF